jgi:hypothetical protein
VGLGNRMVVVFFLVVVVVCIAHCSTRSTPLETDSFSQMSIR